MHHIVTNTGDAPVLLRFKHQFTKKRKLDIRSIKFDIVIETTDGFRLF